MNDLETLAALAGYRLGLALGAGGMARVVGAVHRKWAHPVAVKLLALDHEHGVDAFLMEVRAAARVDHPNVIRVFDHGRVQPADLAADPTLQVGQPWLVMELARETLGFSVDWRGFSAAMSGLLEGLAATHAAGVLHLDVKPSNVLVREDGSVALADFGIARLREQTRSRLAEGSLPYMAPERFGPPGALTVATDLYSVGCTAFQLLTGSVPFRCPSGPVAATMHAAEPVPELRPRFPIPAGAAAWVGRLMEKRPVDRFDCAEAARQALISLGDADLVVSVGGRAAPDAVPTAMTVPVHGDVVDAGAQAPTTRWQTASLTWPDTWPVRPRVRRPAGIGLGLLGLLSVPFVGRERERALLWSALLGAVDGRSSRILVRGPRGAGRSRLGAEFLRVAAAAGAVVDGDRLQIPRVGRPVVQFVEVPGGWSEPAAPGRVEVIALCDQDPVPAAEVERLLRAADAEIWLEPVGVEQTRSLLADWAGLGPELVADVTDVSDGDLGASLATVLAHVRSRGLVPGQFGLMAAQRGGDLPLPDDVIAPWRADVVGVEEGTRVAALLGSRWERDRLFRALPDEAEGVLDALCLRRWVVLRDGWVRWVAVGLRLAVLETVQDGRALHLRCADALQDDPWRAGIHRVEAGDLEALGPLMNQSARIAASGRMSEGTRVLRRVELRMREAGLASSDVHWGQLYRARAVLGPTHQGYQATADWNQAAIDRAREHHASDPRWRGVRMEALSHNVWLAGVRLLPLEARLAMEEIASLEDRTQTLGWWSNVGWTALALGESARAVEAFERCRDMAIESGDHHYRYVSDTSMGVAMCRADQPGALAHLEQSGAAMLEAGYLSAEGDFFAAVGEAKRVRGMWAESEQAYDRALRAAAEGEARADPGFRCGRALLYRDTGRLELAARELLACVQLLTDEGVGWQSLLSLHRLSVACLAGEEVDAAELRSACEGLLQVGLIDQDLCRSAEILVARLAPADGDALAQLERIQREGIERGRTL